jgi:ATP diphosphatase
MPDVKSINRHQEALQRLLLIMAKLRDPETGCPWDKQQTMQSLTRYTIEEAYEAVDAIFSDDSRAITDELGDLLFQIVFYAQIGTESGQFDFADIANAISNKMERRHPHVFAQEKVKSDQLGAQWEKIKREEKAALGQSDEHLLGDIPKGLPALMQAQKIQKKCATVGFDWVEIEPVIDKVYEEVNEIAAELRAPVIDPKAVEEEIGDAFFALVNLARHCKVDADTALRKANNKFSRRFTQVEALAAVQDTTLTSLSLEQMENLWQQVKIAEKAAHNK